MVLNLPQPPYAIAWASPGWLALCGYSSLAEVAGRTLSIVQGPRTELRASRYQLISTCPYLISTSHFYLPLTERAVVDRIVEAARDEQSVEGLRLVTAWSTLLYDAQGRPFRHTLRVTPVRSRSAHDVRPRQ